MNNDLISRSALLKAFSESNHIKETASGLDVMEMLAIKETVDNAPTVEAYTEEDIKRTIKENFDLGYEMAKNKYEKPKESELVKAYTKGFDTGVETVRPKGEWVKPNRPTNGLYVICNQCQCENPLRTNFCPNCGADMRNNYNDSK